MFVPAPPTAIVLAFQDDAARGGFGLFQQQSQQGGLARTGGTGDRRHIARLEDRIQALEQGRAARVGIAQILEAQAADGTGQGFPVALFRRGVLGHPLVDPLQSDLALQEGGVEGGQGFEGAEQEGQVTQEGEQRAHLQVTGDDAAAPQDQYPAPVPPGRQWWRECGTGHATS